MRFSVNMYIVPNKKVLRQEDSIFSFTIIWKSA